MEKEENQVKELHQAAAAVAGQSMHYGDLVYLHVENIDGYLSSTGFSNNNIYVQKDNFETMTFCRNSRDFVFQIQPKMNFDARKDYKQAVKFYQSNVAVKQEAEPEGKKDGAAGPNEARKQTDPHEHQKQMMKQAAEQASYKKKIAQLKKKMVDEEDTNKKLVERRKGEFVTYGSEIQLFHVDSESYLCAKKTCADYEKTCNKVELIDKPSQAIYFKILPRYKYRQEGEKIKYGDQIIFLNMKINLYLHVAEAQIPIEQPIPLPLIPGTTKNEITPVIIDRRCPPVNYVPTYEVNVATTFSRFKAIPFCFHEEDDKRYMRGGCVAKLKHSELGGLLSSDDNDFTDDGLAEVFLWVYKGKEGDVENFNTQSLFEIELAQDHLKGQVGRTSDDKDFQQTYRMRHLNTGRLVTVQEIDFQGQKIWTLGLAEHITLEENPNPKKTGDNYKIKLPDSITDVKDFEDNTLFSFISTNVDNDSRIKNFSCVKVQHVKSGLYLSMKKRALFQITKPAQNDDENSSQQQQDGEFHGKLFEPLDDEEINHANRHVIELKAQAGYEDAFFIQILDKETLKDIMFVHTSVGILKKNIPYLCQGQAEIPKERFNQMDQIMTMLDQFAQCTENQSADASAGADGAEEGGGSSDFDMNTIRDKIIKRQKIMRELYLCEYIVQILFFPFATKSFNLMRITQEDLITRLCQNAYVLLKSAVGGYEINEMYASQWINFFFMQAMKTNKDNDIFAQSTVEELLSDNKKLLEEQITPAIIKQFINLCKIQGKDKKLIKLLTALCTCYGDAVEHNQQSIVKFLLEDRDTREKLMMPIRLRESSVEVKIEGTAYISLSMLEDYSQSRDNGRIYKYFKSLVDLAANLNIGRNSTAFAQLNTIFSFDPVFQIIYDSQLPYDMRSCFLKLINAMHLDREPLEPLAIPTTTVVMNEIPNILDLVPAADNISYPLKSSKVDIPPQLMRLKDFVLDFLRSEHGVQDLQNKKKNKFVFNMILSLYFMLTHGFYRDQDELNNLALPLIMLLDGSDDIYEDDGSGDMEGGSADRYKYTQKNEIILMSKKKQCDCLIYISSLELDGRAELYLAKLKRDYELQGELGRNADGGKVLQIGGMDNQLPQIGANGDIASLDQLKGSISLGLINAIQKQKTQSDKDKLNDPNSVLSKSNVDFLDLVASMKGFEQEIGDIYICILFDLMLYKYPELNQSAFELLIRFFNRKSSLLECLSNIQILESKKSIDILNKVKTAKAQLQIFQSEAEMYMNESDKSSREQKVRATEVFTYLTRYCTVTTNKPVDSKLTGNKMLSLMGGFPNKKSSAGLQEEPEKLDDLLLKLKDEDYVKENLRPEDDSLTPEQEEFIMYLTLPIIENKENQRLMRSFDIDSFATYFIKYRTEEKDAQMPEHIAFMKQCYRFLIRYVRGNVQNQQKLRENLEDYLKDIEKHSLAILLVFEIFKDNKKFLNLNASKILKSIVNAAEKAEMSSSIKGSLYQLLTAFCRYKDKLVRANQQDIVVYMTDKGPQSNILYLFTNEGFKDVNKYIQQQKAVVFPQAEDDVSNMSAAQLVGGKKGVSNKANEDPSTSNPTIFVTNQIINLMACVNLLSLCCEGKSDLAEQKCQTEVITLDNAYGIIKSCEYFWPLKRTFVDYVWQTFLDSNSKTIFVEPYEGNVKIAWQIAEVVLDDMINIIDNFNKESDKEVYVKYPYRGATTLRSESLSFMTDSIFSYFKYLMKRKDIQIDLDGEPIITVFAKQVVNFYYATQDHVAKKKAYNIIGYMYSKQNLSRFLENLKHPLIGLHPGAMKTQETQGDRKDSPMILETINFENSESSKLSSMLTGLMNSVDVKNMIEKEFEELVLWITNIELRVKDIVKNSGQYTEESFENLTFASIVSALLQMLDKKELTKQLHLIGLQIIRKLIEVENRNFVTPSADWDTDDYIEFKGKIVAKQDAMVEIGTVQFLCKHIAEIEDDQLLEQCLLIGISLLIGGNQKAQQAFLNYFQDQDEYNRVLNKLKTIMLKEFDQAKTYLQEKNAKLTMIAKTQERMQQIKLRKAQREMQPNAEEEAKKQLMEEELEGAFPNGTLEDGDGDEQFDDTLEQLMTLDNSAAAGASMITDHAEGGAGGEGAKQKKDEDKGSNDAALSVRKVIRILRFLQLLVEGHFTPLQEHMREQRMSDGQINPKSFDFVGFISTMLGVFEKQYVNCYSCEMGFQMIDTLIELIQGPCKENQRTLVSSKVIDNCRDLISQGGSDRELKIKGFAGEKLDLLNGLKQKSVKLLLSIIEGPIDQEIMRSIIISLDDFVVVFERINYVFLDFIKSHLNLDPEQVQLEEIQNALMKDSFDEEGIQEGFDLFILVKTLADCSDTVKTLIEPYQEFPYYFFFEHNTGYIEILVDTDTLQRVYFPIKPVCRYLSKQSRQTLMLSIDRTSPQQKIIGLLRSVPELLDEMEHIEVLSHSSIKITPTRLNFLRDISTLIALVVSALVLLFYQYGIEYDEAGNAKIGPTIDPRISIAIKVLGYVQFCTAISLLIGQLITRAHLIIKSGWRSYVEVNRIKYQNLINSKKDQGGDSYSVIKAGDLSLLDARMLLLTQGPDAQEFIVDEDEDKRDFGHIILKLEYMWTCTSFVLGNGQVMFLIIYACLSLLGLFQSPIFYSMQLLDIINRFPSLTNVIKAVTVNKNQLLMTAMLELILIWIYCVLLFTFFFDHYFNDDIVYNANEKGDTVCRSLFNCYLSTLNFGLRAGGGIGDFLPSNSYFNDSKETYYLRALNDLSFFMIIIVLFFNIIFGIIIDTFASLRDEKAQMDDDMRNICFICSIDRQSVDKDSEEGFVHHIKKEHNLWQYVFFIIHLNTKDDTDYNGTESFVADKLSQDDISWFPFNKAICLEKDKYLISDK